MPVLVTGIQPPRVRAMKKPTHQGRTKESPAPQTRLLLVEVHYVEGDSETYSLPVVIARGDQAFNITGDHPRGGILRIERPGGEETATLCEAVWEDAFWRPLYDTIARRRVLKGARGEISGEQTRMFRRLAESARERGAPQAASRPDDSLAVTVHGGEQFIRLGLLSCRFQFIGIPFNEMIHPVSLLAILVIDHRVAEIIHMSRCFPGGRVHENSRVNTHNIIMELGHAFPPVIPDIPL